MTHEQRQEYYRGVRKKRGDEATLKLIDDVKAQYRESLRDS